jgi:hypothetical protein
MSAIGFLVRQRAKVVTAAEIHRQSEGVGAGQVGVAGRNGEYDGFEAVEPMNADLIKNDQAHDPRQVGRRPATGVRTRERRRIDDGRVNYDVSIK